MAADNRKLVALVFHIPVFCVYVYSLFYYIVYTAGEPHRETYAGILKFFTFWNQSLQAAYFGYSIINNVFGSNMLPSEYIGHKTSNVSTLQRVRDLISASLAFPGSMFVTASFWTLYSIDRELIFPAFLDEFYPLWLNHQLHTNVLVFLVIERLFIYHEYPRRLRGLSATLIFALTYQLWILWIAFYADIWVYPVLRVLIWPARILFLVVCWLLMFACYFAGEFVTSFLWREEIAQARIAATKGE